MDPITTIEEVKEYLGITDEKSDIKIGRLIPKCTRDYLDIRNAPWDTVGTLTYLGTAVELESTFSILPDDTIVYPDGAKETIAEMISYKLNNQPGEANIASESINSYSKSYGSGKTYKGYPVSIVGSIKKFGRGI